MYQGLPAVVFYESLFHCQQHGDLKLFDAALQQSLADRMKVEGGQYAFFVFLIGEIIGETVGRNFFLHLGIFPGISFVVHHCF